MISPIKVTLLAITILASSYSWADCYFVDPSNNRLPSPLSPALNVSERLIPRDKAVGSTDTAYAHGWDTIFTYCTSVMSAQTTAEISNGKLVPGYTNVYETGIPGIGIQFRAAVPGFSNTQLAPFSMSASPDALIARVFNAGVTLVVTGPIQSGTADGSTLPTMTWRVTQGGARTSYVLRVNGILSVKGQTCKVSDSSINVPMPQVMAKELNKVGATAGDTKFSIDLNSCSPGLGVYVTLTDVSNPGNRSNIVSLTKSSTAQGIGYQVLRNSAPVNFGPDAATAGNPNQWSAGQASGNSFSIPLVARYLRTSDAMQPGSVNGQLSFTMSYQ
uniref:fimbrial protein n=2 Tax=Burkholderia TaxID=32008 RepID=UPI0015C5D3A6|nr:fimbrial protein [Burkholderia sp. AU33423]